MDPEFTITTRAVVLAPSQAALQSDLPKAALSNESANVLLVEDDFLIRSVAAEMLLMLGYGVLFGENGLEALEQYRLHGDQIDVVLLDLSMPGIDGEETFHELRKMNKGVQVIISSGCNEEEIIKRFAGTGMAGFIQKPYRFSVFAQTLRRITGKNSKHIVDTEPRRTASL